MNYSIQGKIDVLVCQVNGNHYKYGMCLYSPKYECKYRHVAKEHNIDVQLCKKWSELEKKVNGQR